MCFLYPFLRRNLCQRTNYKVLFLQGGASQQFAMIPMNLMKNKKIPLMERYYMQEGVIEYHIRNDKDIAKALEVLSNNEEYQKILK